jgi:hypothetical protein
MMDCTKKEKKRREMLNLRLINKWEMLSLNCNIKHRYWNFLLLKVQSKAHYKSLNLKIRTSSYKKERSLRSFTMRTSSLITVRLLVSKMNTLYWKKHQTIIQSIYLIYWDYTLALIMWLCAFKSMRWHSGLIWMNKETQGTLERSYRW